MELHRAGEDYLKAILILQKQNHAVRSMDVAEMLSVTKPSVSRAVKLLREGGFLTMDADKRISLTEAGREAAEQVFEKHRVLTECLVTMGVDPGIAEKDACRMEHLISPETLEQMKIYVGRELAV
ncbi:MAG: metal-dependent transcriptional regulator [Oscillospiraceae bacterium]|nr:metal-dependent transcriptional regulator [Oscillospiraceae bacterium]MBR4550967.1 metal-dependent transcriptional regulator [Oscillospiraceae bacterium]